MWWAGDGGQAAVGWVLGISAGKDVSGVLDVLGLQPGDGVMAVQFTPPEGLGWVNSLDPDGAPLPPPPQSNRGSS